MSVLATEQEKQSALYTAISFIALFLLFFLLKFSDTPALNMLEGGGGGGDVAVNFGDSEFGMGDNFTSTESAKSSPKPTPQVAAAEDEILTSEDNDAPAVANVKKTVDKPKTEDVKPVVKPVVKPQPSNATKNALDDLLKGSDKSGDGKDKVGGNTGKSYGDPNAKGYNGGGGSGTGTGGGNGSGEGIGTGSGYGSGNGGGRGSGTGDYNLSGRKIITKPAPKYTCNEQGRIVVQITVNSTGSVIKAVPGYRGTTNTAQCLLEQAKIAAMNTKFDASPTNAQQQVGTMIYNFKLTD